MMPYRQQTIRGNLERRARLMASVRDFFSLAGYLEVETPLRIPAPAPEAHIDPVASDRWYLHTSPELAMKRLLAAGLPRIYQICRCFRQGERGRRHLPEFTLLEWYTAHEDYGHMMDQTEALVRDAAMRLNGCPQIVTQERTVNLAVPFERLSVAAAFGRWSDVTPAEALDAGRFDEIVALDIEPRLGWECPVFLYDYPAACAALARRRAEQPTVAERFELYIGGVELCNGFSELTDAAEQRRRFEAEQAVRRRAGKPISPLPEAFLSTLPDMPSATGNALGLDRLAMLLTGSEDIDAVTAFIPEEL